LNRVPHHRGGFGDSPFELKKSLLPDLCSSCTGDYELNSIFNSLSGILACAGMTIVFTPYVAGTFRLAGAE